VSAYDLEDALNYIITQVKTLSGIRNASLAPENLAVFPFVVVYPFAGTLETVTPETMKGLHTIAVEFHLARRDLPRDVAAGLPYVELFGKLMLGDPTLGARVETIVGSLSYDFMSFTWGDGTVTLGFRFKIPVKIETSLS
jgi:hypothetical protein